MSQKLSVLFSERPNLLPLIGAVVLALSLFAIPYLRGEDIPGFLSSYGGLFSLLMVLLLLPLFVRVGSETLPTDTINNELVPALSERFSNFNLYQVSPMLQALARLYLQIADQRSSSMKNLALGVGFSVISVTLVINLVFVTRAESVLELPTQTYIYVFLLPRVGAILFIQLIAAFFFRWYGKNLQAIERIGMRMLLIEMKVGAIVHQETLPRNDKTLQWLSSASFSDLEDESERLTRGQRKLVNSVVENLNLTLEGKHGGAV